MNNWNVIGNVGGIRKNGDFWLVDIADNVYDNNNSNRKIKTVWLNCICSFEPKVKVGSKVVAMGVFDKSTNESWPLALILKHLAVVPKDTEGSGLLDGNNSICSSVNNNNTNN